MFLIICRNLCANHAAHRIFILLLHMNIADLIVTFEYLPKQIIHSSTTYWYGGDLLCKITRFFDIFGVSLSSAVLVCMCIDRWLSVYRPFSVGIFMVASHPCNELLTQCIARDYVGLLDSRYVLAYTIATAFYIYFIPLCVIIYCYSQIHYRLRASEALQHCSSRESYRLKMRKAKMKTVRMTWSIVTFFLLCWTPYYLAATLHFIDIDYKTGRSRKNIVIPSFVLKILYMFATMNSSFNGYVYGYFTFNIGRELRDLKAFLLEKFIRSGNDKDPEQFIYKQRHYCFQKMIPRPRRFRACSSTI
ncbi:unnamed protein product [Gongylonema pulchrum]|uniref:G_PROTEIN_RECEP_F1_2 domain-containing protein n=1 Tax=Gongylonema pulchrum TaxID=637853 RepID=A0A183CVG4_9BILA|nr:unnamed protein product [Gongylonema pulchrum]